MTPNPLAPAASTASTLHLAVIGAGPVGLSLALHAARALPLAQVTLFDSRTLDKDVSADPRTLALSLGSVQLLQRLSAWPAEAAQPILEVHVSQQPPTLGGALGGLVGAFVGEPEVRIRAIDEAVPMLGAVLGYGEIVAPLQRRWIEMQASEPQRLHSRFDSRVTGLKNLPAAVEVEVENNGAIVESFDLAVVAEGGVFGAAAEPRVGNQPTAANSIGHDYAQTAWVGQVGFDPAAPAPRGVAFERFTRHGPVALLPRKDGRAALVWCVASDADPVRDLSDAQRIAVLNATLHPSAGRVASITPLKSFALGLTAQRSLTTGRSVRIGNAAQTLHPVAGQGLNLGLRDAYELVLALQRHADIGAVLRRLEWQRAPDRGAMIAATDFLARSFTWKLPGAGTARGLGKALLQAVGPARSALARRMMYGSR